MTNEKNTPEKKFRAGSISATVWRNLGTSKDGQEREFRTISLQRGYKDKNEQWQSTSTFRINDLPKASVVLKQAYEYIVTSNDQYRQPGMQPNLQEEVVM